MPQLDTISFFNQVFFLFLFFTCLYLFLFKNALPSTAFILKMRKKKNLFGIQQVSLYKSGLGINSLEFFLELLFKTNTTLFYSNCSLANLWVMQKRKVLFYSISTNAFFYSSTIKTVLYYLVFIRLS